MNPNNAAFWGARGAPCRPGDWHNVVAERRDHGQREHALNMAAAETAEMRASHGRDTVRVERVVKDVLGGQAQVWKGGGRNKHDNLATGDLDLLIVAPQALRTEDRHALGRGLRGEFGSSRVSESKPRIHQVEGEGGRIDVVPQRATFFGGHCNRMPRDPFKFNPQARHAVRDVKLGAQERGENVRGHFAEGAVLEAQQQHPGASFSALRRYADDELFHC